MKARAEASLGLGRKRWYERDVMGRVVGLGRKMTQLRSAALLRSHFPVRSSRPLPPRSPPAPALDHRRKMSEYLVNNIFVVKNINPDGKKFDKVSRIVAEGSGMYMQLDVATDIYPMKVDQKFTMALASTLNLDGSTDTGYYTQVAGRETLADKFEYVMQGKLYRISEDTSSENVKIEIYASFGGLLMVLKGDPAIASKFSLDQRIFLLIRKL
ncbi:hypothetical protein EJB05_03568, partial [Eragrostis curvula]